MESKQVKQDLDKDFKNSDLIDVRVISLEPDHVYTPTEDDNALFIKQNCLKNSNDQVIKTLLPYIPNTGRKFDYTAQKNDSSNNDLTFLDSLDGNSSAKVYIGPGTYTGTYNPPGQTQLIGYNKELCFINSLTANDLKYGEKCSVTLTSDSPGLEFNPQLSQNPGLLTIADYEKLFLYFNGVGLVINSFSSSSSGTLENKWNGETLQNFNAEVFLLSMYGRLKNITFTGSVARKNIKSLRISDCKFLSTLTLENIADAEILSCEFGDSENTHPFLVKLINCKNIRISNCQFINSDEHISIEGCENILIEDCVIDTGDVGINIQDKVIEESLDMHYLFIEWNGSNYIPKKFNVKTSTVSDLFAHAPSTSYKHVSYNSFKKKLLYVKNGISICINDPDGNNEEIITTGNDAVWSVSGEYIFYTAETQSKIRRFKFEDSSDILIHSKIRNRCEWISTSKNLNVNKIAWIEQGFPNGNDIYICDFDGNNKTRITTDRKYTYFCSFNYNADELCITGVNDPGDDAILEVTNLSATQLVRPIKNQWELRVSAWIDNNYILFLTINQSNYPYNCTIRKIKRENATADIETLVSRPTNYIEMGESPFMFQKGLVYFSEGILTNNLLFKNLNKGIQDRGKFNIHSNHKFDNITIKIDTDQENDTINNNDINDSLNVGFIDIKENSIYYEEGIKEIEFNTNMMELSLKDNSVKITSNSGLDDIEFIAIESQTIFDTEDESKHFLGDVIVQKNNTVLEPTEFTFIDNHTLTLNVGAIASDYIRLIGYSKSS